jgi:hypothetical protein
MLHAPDEFNVRVRFSGLTGHRRAAELTMTLNNPMRQWVEQLATAVEPQ